MTGWTWDSLAALVIVAAFVFVAVESYRARRAAERRRWS